MLARAALVFHIINHMPFFTHASGFTLENGQMYEIGGDYLNIHFAMPAESTGWFRISMFR